MGKIAGEWLSGAARQFADGDTDGELCADTDQNPLDYVHVDIPAPAPIGRVDGLAVGSGRSVAAGGVGSRGGEQVVGGDG